jgi:NADPH:quinone reductase-like Zn-dependent oxidoreductase
MSKVIRFHSFGRSRSTESEILRNPQTAANAKKYILDRLANGSFVPKIATTFPLDQIVDAYNYVQNNEQVGRVIILP